MRQKIVDSLKRRLDTEINPRNPVKFLMTLDIEEITDIAISIVYLYTRITRGSGKKTVYLTEVISAIGHGIRNRYKMQKDSGLAAKAGAFILYSFEEVGLITVTLGQGAKGHATYIIQVDDDDAISALWDNLDEIKTEKLPSETPYNPWTSSKHPTGPHLVKTNNKTVLEQLTPETHPIVFSCINKAMSTGWHINEDIYNIYAWALRNKTDAFADIWEITNPEAKQSKIREAKAIGSIAKRFLGKTFYHLYYYDFRGRKYPATAYLHEQGSDLAKGLLLRSDKKSIGDSGFNWLLISIASNWAGDAGRSDGAKTDKIPLKDRIHWSLDNEEILLSYAQSPKVNQGWMKADKPWQFLAACYELLHLREWQFKHGNFDDYRYESHLECYIDGSNNGSQHLSALTRDEITAPHVNLVPLDLPGDLYKYVADHVWGNLEKRLQQMTKREIKDCECFIDTLIDKKKQIASAPLKSERRKELIDDIIKYKNANKEVLEMASAVFWMRIIDNKQRRKITKRNVMTLPYGGTTYGLGQQQIDDARKHGIELLMMMEHAWGAFMGREIFESCKVSLKKPMQLLSIFEMAGKEAESKGEFLHWTIPITNFPVVQHYTEGIVKKVWVQYGPQKGERLNTGYFENTLQLFVCFIENVRPSKHKQSQGAAPNAIHSLDAAHLMIAVDTADFPITTIHDSFGCLLGDMPDLFKIIRQSFLELYSADPLSALMRDIGGDLSCIELGTLDLTLVLDSEYCFS